MKMTKEIKVINVYKEEVTIKPIEYNTALKLITEHEENALLIDYISKLVCKLYEAGAKNIKENKEVSELLAKYDAKKEELEEIRKELNYWYYGVDNLDIEDIKVIEKKYDRRRVAS